MIFSRNELVELSKEVAIVNEKWNIDPVTGLKKEPVMGRCLMLIVSELSEALEGIRKDLWDTHLPHRKMEEVEMADALIRLLDFVNRFDIDILADIKEIPSDIFENNPFSSNTKEENLFEIVGELSNLNPYQMDDEWWMNTNTIYAITSVLQYCRDWNLDLRGAVREKMEYNKNREDHKIESRLAENGKKW